MKLFLRNIEPKLVDEGTAKEKPQLVFYYEVTLAGLLTEKEFETLKNSQTQEGIEIGINTKE